MGAKKPLNLISLGELTNTSADTIDEMCKKYPKRDVEICLKARYNSEINKSDYKHEVYQEIINNPVGFFKNYRRKGTVYENFMSVYHIYVSLHKIYSNNPKKVNKDFWQDKIISALAAQPYFNLPSDKSLLYSGKISKKAKKAILEAGGLTKARRLSGDSGVLEEHYFPRKFFLKIELFDIENPVSFNEFVYLYFTKGGKYHITTKLENSNLEKRIASEMEKDNRYDPLNWQRNYSLCEIELIEDV